VKVIKKTVISVTTGQWPRSLRAEPTDFLKQHPEAKEDLDKVLNMLTDITSLVGCTPQKIGESEPWARVVHRAEVDRVNLCRLSEAKFSSAPSTEFTHSP
jgi:hypothetical protein